MKSLALARHAFNRVQNKKYFESGLQNTKVIACSFSTESSSEGLKDTDEVRTSSQGPADYDVIIAGGGLVGTALAVALGRSKRLNSKKILLLESAKETLMKTPNRESDKDFSNRVVALSPGSKNVFEKLGIWESVWRFQEVNSLQVWDALSDSSISFNNPGFTSPVSYIVENPVLAYAISKTLDETSNVEVQYGTLLKSCRIPAAEGLSDLASIELQDGRRYSTKLLVGADGYNSRVRKAINSSYINFNYDRTAVVATLQLSEPTDNNTAWQRFLPTGGPIALLPLSSSYSSLVWSTTPQRAKVLMEMSSEDFLDAINSAFWHEYPRSALVAQSYEILKAVNLSSKGARIFPPSVGEVLEGSRATFPLGFGHSTYYVSRRTALIGDAAHRVHPLAGQGLNLGIGDVECLSRVIDRAVGLGSDIGSLNGLQTYETERQRHNVTIQSGIEFMHRLYSFDYSPVVALRSVGLSLFNSSDTLKKFIIAQAAA